MMGSINAKEELPFNYNNSITDELMANGKLEEAEKILNAKEELKVLFIGNPRTEKKITAMNYGTWGNLFTYRNNFVEAEKNYKKALKIYLELDNQSEGIGITYANLGGIYALMGDISEAKKCWKEAHFVFSVIGDEWRGELVDGWLNKIK